MIRRRAALTLHRHGRYPAHLQNKLRRQPTSPSRAAGETEAALEKLLGGRVQADGVIAVVDGVQVVRV